MHNYFIPTVLLVATTITGCSSIPENNTAMNETRNNDKAAQSNSQIVKLASDELKQTCYALDKHRQTSAIDEEPGKFKHLVYLYKQHAVIAQENVQQKNAELAAQLAAINVTKTSRGTVISIEDVLFDNNKAKVKPRSTPKF